MHFIDKNPVPVKNALDMAIKKRTKETRDKYVSNPILKMVPPKAKQRNAPRNPIKQYGDKGYTPSTGKGVGH